MSRRQNPINDEKAMEAYRKAEEAMGYNAASLRLMALLAYDHRSDRDALKVYGLVWGRSARVMAQAVERWPSWFMSTEAEPLREAEPEELLCLFRLAALKREESEHWYNAWREHGWRLWQLRHHIETRNIEARKEKTPSNFWRKV